MGTFGHEGNGMTTSGASARDLAPAHALGNGFGVFSSPVRSARQACAIASSNAVRRAGSRSQTNRTGWGGVVPAR